MSPISNPLVIAAGGYVVAFALMWLLLRFEYEMPVGLSVAFSGAAVVLGFSIAFAGHVAGVASFPELSGLSGTALVATAIGLALVG